MQIKGSCRLFLAFGVCFLARTHVSFGDIIASVSLNTAPLVAGSAGPFSLDFELIDGSGTNDGNNSVILTGFSFGSGGSAGTATLTGGATGDLLSGVTLTDSSFLNDFAQPFVPGSILSFTLQLSTNQEVTGFPDEFTFAILDRTGGELPTQSFFDVFVDIDITAQTTVQTFGSDPTRAPRGGGPPLSIPAPTVQGIVPEPSDLIPLAVGLAMIICGALCASGTRREGKPARGPR